LRLRWPHHRVLTSLGVVAPIGTAVAPTSAELMGNQGRTRVVDLTKGRATFAPMKTRRLVIRFDAPTSAGSAPVGVAELDIANLEDQVHRTDRDRTTGAVCGLGPELEVDGRTYPTKVTGTIGAVLDGTPLAVSGCGPPVRLSGGAHEVRMTATEQYTATRLTLRPSEASDTGLVTQRDVGVASWTTSRRVLDVAAGPAALLVVPENVNAGWRATLEGDELTPLRVDGWMQGYLLPAGDGGRVTLEFTPNRLYQAGLALGGLLALLLVTAAVLAGRREERSPPLLRPAPQATARVRSWPWRWRLPALAAGALLGGPAFAAGLLVGDLGRRRLGDPGAVGAVLVGAAAVAAGWMATQQASRAVLPPTWCDVLAGVGVGLVASVLLTRASRRSGRV
jgi:arabinofuranan 3-O-arabinosyltransferase